MSLAERVILIILDSVGVGALPDARLFGDEGANTLGHTAHAVGGLRVPHMEALGLGNILDLEGVPPAAPPAASFGRMAELSAGKDTTTGHWEICGIIQDKPFPLYPHGFPTGLIQDFEQAIGRKVLGNKPASGTEIIKELGEEHMRTGHPIVYTSGDSVFQVAAHEEVIPLEELYRICRVARQMLQGEHAVGRVIARPFVGEPGSFQRTAHRHDFSLSPPGPTLLDLLQDAGWPVVGVGKIKDIFAGQGISRAVPTESNQDGMDKLVQLMAEEERGFIFVNLVETDSLWGHRNDPQGYARSLEEFDARLPEVLERMRPRDALFISADHGCDPTTPGTDHTREYVPLLIHGQRLQPGVDLGVRESFSDLGATIAELLGSRLPVGRSMLPRL